MVHPPPPLSSIPVFSLPDSISTPGTPQVSSFLITDTDTTSDNNDENKKPPFSDPRALLLYVYEDLRRFKEIATENVMLHAADRYISGSGPLVGVEACQQHEERFGKRVKMRVEDVMANDCFGCVMGVMEVGDDIKEKFCGIWRFIWERDRVKAVEHWENLNGIEGVRKVMGGL
ncbi:hypothetical protein QBC38DRAFT_470637 [Podospora fimiseda]|uniref:SnoaL-like domain-containing protein n=1 Tax=Podospora fimiseda TaxID=252190 RepID=A0AAN7BUH9_9PEZI|nr:hypothetical protein QBC38DRAFT_470637 [Podospora fimiseda]